MIDVMDLAFARVLKLTEGLPGLERGTSYGTPALLVRGKSFMRVKEDAATIVLHCPIEQKDMLMAAAPAIYFETDHYKGWPAVLIRLAAIPDAELRQRLIDGWRHKAPKRLVAEHDAQAAAEGAMRAQTGK